MELEDQFAIANALVRSLKKDGICTVAGFILSVGVLISTALIELDVWWLDATIAVLVAVVLFVYGVRTLISGKHTWWQKAWWQGDVTRGMVRLNEESLGDVRVSHNHGGAALTERDKEALQMDGISAELSTE